MSAEEKLKAENPLILIIPVEETAKGLKFATLSKKEWELTEESADYWKFKKI